MVWKTAATGGNDYDGSLPDDEKIVVTLKSYEFVPNKFQPDEKRLELVWETEGALFPIKAWTSLRLGMKGTTIGTMRQIINAIHGRRPSEEVFAINDETLEYVLEPVPDLAKAPVDGAIEPGVRVAVMGTNVETKTADGESVTYFNVTQYRAAPAAAQRVTRRAEPEEDKEPVAPGQRGRSRASF